MTFDPWQWALLAFGASMIGLSKSGIPGIAIMTVAIFTNLLPAKAATGFVLPLLIVGDIFAVSTYRAHTQWRHVLRLFPWAAAGVIGGYFALRVIDNSQAAVIIGIILFLMLGLHLYRGRKSRAELLEHEIEAHAKWLAPLAGIFAGITTMIANAAGPVMIIYLLAMRLPKLEFLGTGAVFFMAINLFKVPLMVNLDMINIESLQTGVWIAPAVVVGSFVGRAVAGHIPQKLFERFALILTFFAAAKLIFDQLV
jgi:uncharacterized membrane protein YfcA